MMNIMNRVKMALEQKEIIKSLTRFHQMKFKEINDIFMN